MTSSAKPLLVTGRLFSPLQTHTHTHTHFGISNWGSPQHGWFPFGFPGRSSQFELSAIVHCPEPLLAKLKTGFGQNRTQFHVGLFERSSVGPMSEALQVDIVFFVLLQFNLWIYESWRSELIIICISSDI